jgi:hypothetical protein
VISPTAIYVLGDYMAYGPPERAVTAFWNGTEWSASLFSHAPYEENVHSGQQCGDKYYMLMTPVHWSMSMPPTEIYEVDLDTGQYTLISGYDLDISKVKVLACLGDDMYIAGAIAMGHPPAGEPFDYASLVRWDGSTTEVITVDGSINALTVHDGMLYAGGRFSTIDGVAASNVARWNGLAWQALGAGVTGPNAAPLGGSVSQLSFSGDDLYVGGAFASAGGQIAHSLAIWHEDHVVVVPPPTRLFLPMLSR